jgi:hypothetical protein
VFDETCRIVASGAKGGRIVQQPDHCFRLRLGGEPGQRALARLPGAVEGNHPGVAQRFGDQVAGFAGH